MVQPRRTFPATEAATETAPVRHVLLEPANPQHLSDGELDFLHAATLEGTRPTLEEMKRRAERRKALRQTCSVNALGPTSLS